MSPIGKIDIRDATTRSQRIRWFLPVTPVQMIGDWILLHRLYRTAQTSIGNQVPNGPWRIVEQVLDAEIELREGRYTIELNEGIQYVGHHNQEFSVRASGTA